MYDVSYNRVYWEYYQTKTYMRPKTGYFCHKLLPSLGARVTSPPYKKCGADIREDYELLVTEFAKKYADHEFVISLSGGIDSEFCAETFYLLGIPFRCISLRLFDGANDHDLLYAARYCRDRNIDLKIHNLSMDQLCDRVVQKAYEFGQFTHSGAQVALTHLFDHVHDNEILINSGHNPDYCASLGWGWWEDSPNMVKYAINKDKKFMTFTSLEPIFVHYMKNYDGNQPGDKDNKFLYEQYPHLRTRRKMTGWESATKELLEVEHLIRVACNYDHLTFITWEEITRKRKKKIEHELDEFFAKGRKKLNETWISYKLLTGVEIGKY